MENVKHIVDKEDNRIFNFFHKEPLFVQTKISSDDLEQIKEKSKFYLDHNNKLSKANKSLAGNIEKEYNLDESFYSILSPYFNRLANQFALLESENEDKENKTKHKYNWKATDIWINLQKKYEFNPVHNHSGEYSFVLWVQIPYDLEKEFELENCKNSNCPENALFNFLYTRVNREITTSKIRVDKNYEGTIILFSSSLHHSVNPFYTSDDYRISISGNIIKSVDKKSFSYQ